MVVYLCVCMKETDNIRVLQSRPVLLRTTGERDRDNVIWYQTELSTIIEKSTNYIDTRK